MCKSNPDMLHQPSMAFYKEYLESLGAKIPPPKVIPTDGTSASKSYEEQQDEPEMPEPEPEIPYPELDETGVIEDKSGTEELSMGNESKEVTEEDAEKSNEFTSIANIAFSEGDYEKALENFTKAIECNPGRAILHAKRANTLIKMSKLSLAIRDCDEAIRINADSAQGYKFRGRARKLLGHWVEAHTDLALACKLDYDDVAYEWLKEVEPNAKKLQDYIRAKERVNEEKELRERKARIKRAQEANAKAAEEQQGEAGAGFGGAGPFADLFKDDPELMEAIRNDPSMMAKLLECMQNPANMMKYMNDPLISKLLSKFSSKMFPCTGGNQKFDFGSAPEDAQPKQPKKGPEPDLD